MSFERISPQTLHDWLESDNPPSVVDVRDHDRFGGHVKESVNVPSHRFLRHVDELTNDLKDKDRVVFYCQLSQQRGPSCAAVYADRVTDQKVYVLDGGFQNWAESIGEDAHTASFVKSIYK